VYVETHGVRKKEQELTEKQKAEYGLDKMPPVLFPQELGEATADK
jgi:hypothetical protein